LVLKFRMRVLECREANMLLVGQSCGSPFEVDLKCCGRWFW
jgi:hypothetical protein